MSLSLDPCTLLSKAYHWKCRNFVVSKAFALQQIQSYLTSLGRPAATPKKHPTSTESQVLRDAASRPSSWPYGDGSEKGYPQKTNNCKRTNRRSDLWDTRFATFLEPVKSGMLFQKNERPVIGHNDTCLSSLLEKGKKPTRRAATNHFSFIAVFFFFLGVFFFFK